ARQRAVNRALQAEFDAGLHALSMELKAPGE
ncbi:MAG: BolA/IbaG family iron-sulfur metabolism protein, partial [Pseudomonadota bacterium]